MIVRSSSVFPASSNCRLRKKLTNVAFGDSKINLHLSGKEFEPKAQHVQPGSADLCFLVEEDVQDVLKRLQEKGIQYFEGGVVTRTGARAQLRSVYIRDPDGNLIEHAIR